MTIGVWGDSITYGQGDSEALGWVGRLKKSVEANDVEDSVYNFGVRGDTTEDTLKRFKPELEAIEPEIVIFAIGINDAKFLSGAEVNNVPLENYKKNLESLIDQSKVFAEHVIIVGATKVDDEWRSAQGSRFLNEEIERYNEAMRQISNDRELNFIDMFDAINPESDLADGLHPNTQGYQKMFEKVTKEVSSLY